MTRRKAASNRDNPTPTINDIARLAGVSKKTVSRVINRSQQLTDETRERVETIIREIGYVPNPQARALALRRNFLIGLVHDNPNAQMILNVQEGILDGLRGTDFEMVVRPVNRLSPSLLSDISHFIARQRLFGVVILPPISENDDIARVCVENGCRYVRMGSAVFDDNAHIVASNDRDAVHEATTFLIEQGHRRIGIVVGPRGFRSSAERLAGFNAAMSDAGLAPSDALQAEGEYTFDSGLSAARKLLAARPRPSAIFASNDEMAAAVLFSARMQGIEVPEELSIVGFDDTPIASRVWPPLTTVRWPIVAMGKAAATKLVGDATSDKSAPLAPSRFESTLVLRKSVARPP